MMNNLHHINTSYLMSASFNQKMTSQKAAHNKEATSPSAHHSKPSFKHSSSAGFTLMEVLVALAITSLASLALFQSMTMWFTISGKASSSANKAIGNVVHDAQFRAIISGLVPGWNDIENEQFTGTSTFFSGLSTNQLHLDGPALEIVTVQLIQNKNKTLLNYDTFATGWTLQEFIGAEAKFEYLGDNGQWHQNWPPKESIFTSSNALDDLIATPQLPAAIKLNVFYRDFTPSKTSITIANIGSDPVLPRRDKDLINEFITGG